jgi:hypothetical protein
LFHGEAVLVEASVDSEDVSFELFSEGIGLNFLSHSLLKEDPASVIVVDFEGLSGAVGGVGDTELHRKWGTFMFYHKII